MSKMSVPNGEGGIMEIVINDGKPDYTWSSEPPTKEGFYWAIENGYPDGMLLVEVFNASKGRLLVSLHGYEDDKTFDNFTHWLGPLPVPEPPKE